MFYYKNGNQFIVGKSCVNLVYQKTILGNDIINVSKCFKLTLTNEFYICLFIQTRESNNSDLDLVTAFIFVTIISFIAQHF